MSHEQEWKEGTEKKKKRIPSGKLTAMEYPLF